MTYERSKQVCTNNIKETKWPFSQYFVFTKDVDENMNYYVTNKSVFDGVADRRRMMWTGFVVNSSQLNDTDNSDRQLFYTYLVNGSTTAYRNFCGFETDSIAAAEKVSELAGKYNNTGMIHALKDYTDEMVASNKAGCLQIKHEEELKEQVNEGRPSYCPKGDGVVRFAYACTYQ